MIVSWLLIIAFLIIAFLMIVFDFFPISIVWKRGMIAGSSIGSYLSVNLSLSMVTIQIGIATTWVPCRWHNMVWDMFLNQLESNSGSLVPAVGISNSCN